VTQESPALGDIVLVHHEPQDDGKPRIPDRYGLVVGINPARSVFVVLTSRAVKYVTAKNLLKPDLVAMVGSMERLELMLPVMVSPVCTRDRIKTTRVGIWTAAMGRRRSELLFSVLVNDLDPITAIRNAWETFTKRWERIGRVHKLGFVEFKPVVMIGETISRAHVFRPKNRQQLSEWRNVVRPLVGRHPECLDGRTTPTA